MSFERPRSIADWFSAGAVLVLLCILVYPLLHIDHAHRQLFVHSDSWLTMLFLAPTTLIWIISYAICIWAAVAYLYRAITMQCPWSLVEITNDGDEYSTLMPIALLICGIVSAVLFKQMVYPSLVGGRSMYEWWLVLEVYPLFALLRWIAPGSSSSCYAGSGAESSSEDAEEDEIEIDYYANEYDMNVGYGNRDESQMRWQRDSPNKGLRKDYNDIYNKHGRRRK